MNGNAQVVPAVNDGKGILPATAESNAEASLETYQDIEALLSDAMYEGYMPVNIGLAPESDDERESEMSTMSTG